MVFETASGMIPISDNRTDKLAAYDRESVALLRNRPGGFWVASTAPEAAAEALIGAVPMDGLQRLLMCTDGVSRLVDFFGQSWSDVFAIAERRGHAAAINAVRECEMERPEGLERPGRKVKQHDDATLVLRLS